MNTEKKPRVNTEIRAANVRLIGSEGEQLGVVTMLEAIKIRDESGLDLVEVSPETDPPVCRIMDYGKYKFQLSKRKKRPKQIQIKEIKIRPGTDIADFQVKLRNAIKFLEGGDKVKVTMRFRGREMAHPELGMKVLEKMVKEIAEFGVIEQHPKFEGRQIVMILGPKKK